MRLLIRTLLWTQDPPRLHTQREAHCPCTCLGHSASGLPATVSPRRCLDPDSNQAQT